MREGERKRGGDVLELDALIVTLHLVWSGPAVLYIFFLLLIFGLNYILTSNFKFLV